MEPTTLSSHKSAFLTTQIRLLSSPLQPSPAFQSTCPSPSPISPKLLADILTKINAKLQSHTRQAFPPATQRHVVEQIESLYFSHAIAETATHNTTNTTTEENQGEDFTTLSLTLDLTSTENLSSLPQELHQAMLRDTSDLAIPAVQADEYTTLLTRLLKLARERDAKREKVARYEKLRGLLAGFEEGGGVQGNLVTREGGVEREMERMRGLVVRVLGRLGRGGEGWNGLGEGKSEEEGQGRGFDEKLRTVMEMG